MSMIELHFICPNGLNHRHLGGAIYESGNWSISDRRADEARGGRIYLHKDQKSLSWHGGTIEGWRSINEDRKVFVYRAEGELRVRCLGIWGQEKATVRTGEHAQRETTTFWLTYKPLGPGATTGWSREKLRNLVRRFEADSERTTEWWRLSATRLAKVGDKVFVFKQGNERRGIFGRGEIVSGPAFREDSSGGDGKKWRVEVRFSALVDPETDLLLPLEDFQDALALEPNNLANMQISGTRVPLAIATEISARLDALTHPLRYLSSEDADDRSFVVREDEDQRERALRAICTRRGQPAFRAALIDAYGGRCAISGCAILDVLEAAHIIPYNGLATSHVNNGLLLRTDLHTLFDSGLIAVDPNTRKIVVAKKLQGSSYKKLEGRKVRDAQPLTLGPTQKMLERAFRSFKLNRAG